ncbi:hypothetical protein PybrP1_001080 [[Pythium] brassicae (nom. inval.)]|nr:hypothetical protein PybrP1_001080 [[Pythium] brassicae (nom. inval.)]
MNVDSILCAPIALHHRVIGVIQVCCVACESLQSSRIYQPRLSGPHTHAHIVRLQPCSCAAQHRDICQQQQHCGNQREAHEPTERRRARGQTPTPQDCEGAPAGRILAQGRAEAHPVRQSHGGVCVLYTPPSGASTRVVLHVSFLVRQTHHRPLCVAATRRGDAQASDLGQQDAGGAPRRACEERTRAAQLAERQARLPQRSCHAQPRADADPPKSGGGRERGARTVAGLCASRAGRGRRPAASGTFPHSDARGQPASRDLGDHPSAGHVPRPSTAPRGAVHRGAREVPRTEAASPVGDRPPEPREGGARSPAHPQAAARGGNALARVHQVQVSVPAGGSSRGEEVPAQSYSSSPRCFPQGVCSETTRSRAAGHRETPRGSPKRGCDPEALPRQARRDHPAPGLLCRDSVDRIRQSPAACSRAVHVPAKQGANFSTRSAHADARLSGAYVAVCIAHLCLDHRIASEAPDSECIVSGSEDSVERSGGDWRPPATARILGERSLYRLPGHAPTVAHLVHKRCQVTHSKLDHEFDRIRRDSHRARCLNAWESSAGGAQARDNSVDHRKGWAISVSETALHTCLRAIPACSAPASVGGASNVHTGRVHEKQAGASTGRRVFTPSARESAHLDGNKSAKIASTRSRQRRPWAERVPAAPATPSARDEPTRAARGRAARSNTRVPPTRAVHRRRSPPERRCSVL